MNPSQALVKWLLASLLAVTMSMAGIAWKSLADDVKAAEKNVEQLKEVVNEIKTYQAVDKALQETQTKVLDEQRQVLGAILETLQKQAKPATHP